jgi:hypothetical protein
MTSQHTGLVDIELTDKALVITPRGMWKIWSLRRSQSIPYRAISAARVSANPTHELQPRWRNPGLGTLTTLAGYTSGPRGRTWWCYKYGNDAIILDLNLPRLKHAVFIHDGGKEVIDAIESHLRPSDTHTPSRRPGVPGDDRTG